MTAAVPPFRDWRAYRIILDAAPIRPLRGATPETLISSLGFDSIQLVGLYVELEETFAISLPCDTVAEARTVGELVAIAARAAEQQHPQHQPETDR